MENTFQDVFDCYPDVEQIHVVGSMPFLSHAEAYDYAGKDAAKVRIVKRGGELAAETQNDQPPVGKVKNSKK